MPKRFECDHPYCGKFFGRSCDLLRHKRTHCEYEERAFGCPHAGCGFRANQRGGLQCHLDSIHDNLRKSCGMCIKTFSDPSSLSKHRRIIHEVDAEGNAIRRQSCPSANTIPLLPMVAHPVDEDSVQDSLDQLATFSIRASSTPPPDNPPNLYKTRPPASRSASSGPSTLTYRSTNSMQSPPRERRGGFHPVTDVPTDCWSTDPNNHLEHQAYDANPMAAPTAWGYYPNAPVPSSPPLYAQEPTTYHPPQPLPPNRMTTQEGTDLDHNQSCRCQYCVLEGPLTLAPLRGQHEEGMRAQPQSEAPLPFSYPRVDHVPSSDQWMLPNQPSSSVYPRPDPRMLFGFR